MGFTSGINATSYLACSGRNLKFWSSYYNANKKKLTNAVSSELEGFRRPKDAQMKGNIVKMV